MTTRAQAVRWKIARRHLNQRRTHRLWWILALVVLLLLATSSAGAGAGFYFAAHLPSAGRFHVHYDYQDARIYDARGDLLYDLADLTKKHGQRMVEPLQGRWDTTSACRGGVNRIPRDLQNATIATEDATFYKNPGFDPGSIVRAAYQDIVYGHILSGASTITQQLVRANHLVSNERSLTRKAQEVALAYEISKRVSKREILWYYLNSVPYGNLAIGAQAASRVYFGIPVCGLDPAQAAMLAGLPQAPTLFDPVLHPGRAGRRMSEVLHLMVRHGYLRSKVEIAGAMREANGWHFRAPTARMRYPQFTRFVIDQIQHMPLLRARLYQGIDIYTTLDPRLQDLAQQTVTRQIQGLTAQHVTNGALVSLDLRTPRAGWILSMVGNARSDAGSQQINMAVAPRQPGSSMKPFNYIWAFTHGNVSPATTVSDSPVKLPDPNSVPQRGWYEPIDYDHQWHGTVTLRQALANSLNVPAVKLEYYVTKPKNVARTAATFGMTSLYRDNPGLDCQVCYAVTLGGLSKGTRLLEETSAYGVFARGGLTVPPVAIWKVVSRGTGHVLYCSSNCPRGVGPDPALAPKSTRVLDSAHAYEMTDVLADNNARCTPQVCEFGWNSALALDRPAAAKTGTTNSFTDNWTLGYTPQLVTGVWVGNADRSPMQNVIGVTGAAPIWHDFMEGAFKVLKLPVRQFVAPTGVERVDRCAGRQVTSYQVVTPDLFVPQLGGPAMPQCSLPERGYMPVPCSRYPANPSGFPLPLDCGPGPSYAVTYTGQRYAYGPLPNSGVQVPTVIAQPDAGTQTTPPPGSRLSGGTPPPTAGQPGAVP
ncbi:MAG: transglycosylase domain-containing protein [Chloroflexota bacterium]|nr:MAG: hypothetical protein DLM70_06425 [Chloroflexota bacterium]